MCVKALSTCQWQIKGRGPGPPLFLDQTDAQRVEIKCFLRPAPLLSQGLDDRPPPPTPHPPIGRSGSATECNAFSTELAKNSAYPRDEAPYYRWYVFSSRALFSKWSVLRP